MQWFDLRYKRPEDQQDIVAQIFYMTNDGKTIKVRTLAGKYNLPKKTREEDYVDFYYGSIEVEIDEETTRSYNFMHWLPLPKPFPTFFVE